MVTSEKPVKPVKKTFKEFLSLESPNGSMQVCELLNSRQRKYLHTHTHKKWGWGGGRFSGTANASTSILAGQTETRKRRTGMCLPPLCDDEGKRCIGRDAAQRHQGKAPSTLVILQTATHRHSQSQQNGQPYSDQTMQPSFPLPDHTKNKAKEKWWPLRVVFQFHQGALNRMVSPQGGLS